MLTRTGLSTFQVLELKRWTLPVGGVEVAEEELVLHKLSTIDMYREYVHILKLNTCHFLLVY